MTLIVLKVMTKTDLIKFSQKDRKKCKCFFQMKIRGGVGTINNLSLFLLDFVYIHSYKANYIGFIDLGKGLIVGNFFERLKCRAKYLQLAPHLLSNSSLTCLFF